MSMKTVYLDLRQLKRVRDDVTYLGSDELKEELDIAISKDEGAYLLNILSDECFRELCVLKNNFSIMGLSGIED